MTFRAGIFAFAFVTCGLALPRVAGATPPSGDKAAAQALFEDALKLMAKSRYDEACPKLEESQRLDAAMGTRFRLAQCYETIGRTASAWAGYTEVADLARAAGQEAREKAARERAAILEPKLSRVKIVVATPDQGGLEIRRGDVVVGAAQWGTAIPVDPGSYRITASAPGKTAWSGQVTVSRDGGSAATVQVPALEDAPAAALPHEPASRPAPAAAPLAATETPPAGGRRTLGVVVLATGLVGIGTSAVLGLVAKSNYNATGAHCQGDICDAEGKQTTDAARHLGDVATVIFGVGAALALGGGVLWVTAPRAPASPRKVSVRVRAMPQAVLVEGSF